MPAGNASDLALQRACLHRMNLDGTVDKAPCRCLKVNENDPLSFVTHTLIQSFMSPDGHHIGSYCPVSSLPLTAIHLLFAFM